MPTTPLGLPYPEPTDPVASGANDFRSLAEAIDPLLTARNLPARLAAVGEPINDLDGAANGWYYYHPTTNGAPPGGAYGIALVSATSSGVQGGLIAFEHGTENVWIRDAYGGAPWRLIYPPPARLGADTLYSSVPGNDLNTLHASGWYLGAAANANKPAGAFDGNLLVLSFNAGWTRQIWHELYNATTFMRQSIGGAWTAWEKIWPPAPVYACKVRSTVALTLPPQAWTGMLWQVADYDPYGMCPLGGAYINAPVAGLYLVSFSGRDGAGSGGRLIVGGQYDTIITHGLASNQLSAGYQFSKPVYLGAGQSVAIQLFNDASSNTYSTVIEPFDPSFSLARIG